MDPPLAEVDECIVISPPVNFTCHKFNFVALAVFIIKCRSSAAAVIVTKLFISCVIPIIVNSPLRFTI